MCTMHTQTHVDPACVRGPTAHRAYIRRKTRPRRHGRKPNGRSRRSRRRPPPRRHSRRNRHPAFRHLLRSPLPPATRSWSQALRPWRRTTRPLQRNLRGTWKTPARQKTFQKVREPSSCIGHALLLPGNVAICFSGVRWGVVLPLAFAGDLASCSCDCQRRLASMANDAFSML